jgi:hypothetical protein
MEPGHICPDCTLARVSPEQLQANKDKIYREMEEWRQRTGAGQPSTQSTTTNTESSQQPSSSRHVAFATNSAIPEQLYSRSQQWATATPVARRPITTRRSAPYPDGPRRTSTRQLPRANRENHQSSQAEVIDEEMEDSSETLQDQ